MATQEGRGTLATYEVTKTDKRFIGAHILVAVIALSIGTLFGPLQAFELAGVDLYPYLQPVFKSYYQGLTIHGVLNALVWTTFFITGFFTLTTLVGFKRGLRYPKLNRVGFWTMVVGLVMAAVPILLDEASVLYTFYPPLQANWAFYAGLTLVVVGSWIEGYGFFFTYRAWRKDNPDTRTPFIAFGGLVTMAMWQFATLGIAVTRSCISGCCPRTCPGTGCCPDRPAANSSPIRWRGWPCGYSCCCRYRSGSTTSSLIRAYRPDGSTSTPRAANSTTSRRIRTKRAR